VGHDAHGNEDYQQIDNDGHNSLEADNNEYDTADRIAETKP